MSDVSEQAKRPRKLSPRKAADSAPTTTDAIEIAMEAEASGKPASGVAHRLLERQAQLIGWQIAGERASFALKLLTGAVGVIAFVIIGVLLWSASQYRGLTVQPFSVPPELEARGLNGTVVATRLLDQLSTLQKGTISLRAANTYANSWGDDIEVQIPQTGVSAGELWKFLRSWLGQEVKITGEVVRAPDGRLQVTARAGGQPAPVFTGTETELEALLIKAAESLYGSTQPYRYGIYLSRTGRRAESMAVLQQLAQSGGATDRKWALAGWSLGLQGAGRFEESIDACTAASDLDPKFGLAYANCGGTFFSLGRAEEGYRALKASLGLFDGSPDLNPEMARSFGTEMRASVLEVEHDTLGAAAAYGEAAADEGGSQRGNRDSQARMLAAARDIRGALKLRRVGGARAVAGTEEAVTQAFFDIVPALSLEEWPAAASMAERIIAGQDGSPVARAVVAANFHPLLAYARARGGDIAGAEAALQGAPLSSYGVLIAHGQVAAIKGDGPASERWFARAAAAAPSLADAEQAWGRARLDRRDWAGAIDRYKVAAERAPRWEDPLKGWGDALAGQGDHKAALKKYEAAAERAPRWGKLHISWGRSLAALGRRDEALAKWRAAAGMDLSSADRAAVTRLLGGSAR